jgi:hypothetical protein
MSDSPDSSDRRSRSRWRQWIDATQSASIIALAISLFSFYRSYVYVSQKLEVTVTEVSYGTNRGELYMTVAFSNGGNRDAAVLRIEPALWAHGSGNGGKAIWVPIAKQVAPDVPLVSPRAPLVVKSGGVEVVRLSTWLNPKDAEASLVKVKGDAFLGIRVATMNSDGNLYLLEHPVAQMHLGPDGRIMSAEAAIHRSLFGFSDLADAPPGDAVTNNKQTPFVWAEEHYE